LGATSIAAGAWLVSRDDAFSEGAGYPLLSVGAIQFGTGVGYLIWSAYKRKEVVAAAKKDAPGTAKIELERMAPINSGFPIYKIVEATAAATGFGVLIAGKIKDDSQWMGIGTSLGAAALVQLGMEFLAQAVAHKYTRALQLTVTPAAIGLSFPW
jgi:hypothetical protein